MHTDKYPGFESAFQELPVHQGIIRQSSKPDQFDVLESMTECLLHSPQW